MRVLVHFFSLPLVFSLVAASISYSPTAATKFSCCSSNKKNLSFVFYLYFLVELRWPVAYFLFFSVFQICGHDNKSKLNTLDNTVTETISAFRFRLY